MDKTNKGVFLYTDMLSSRKNDIKKAKENFGTSKN